jgi:hypothetical protein
MTKRRNRGTHGNTRLKIGLVIGAMFVATAAASIYNVNAKADDAPKNTSHYASLVEIVEPTQEDIGDCYILKKEDTYSSLANAFGFKTKADFAINYGLDLEKEKLRPGKKICPSRTAEEFYQENSAQVSVKNSNAPADISAKLDQWSAEYKIDRVLIESIVYIESEYNPNAYSAGGAIGLFQVMPYHFQAGENPYDLDTNAKRGIEILKGKLAYTSNNLKATFAGYNGGNKASDWFMGNATRKEYVAYIYEMSYDPVYDVYLIDGVDKANQVELYVQRGMAAYNSFISE